MFPKNGPTPAPKENSMTLPKTYLLLFVYIIVFNMEDVMTFFFMTAGWSEVE